MKKLLLVTMLFYGFGVYAQEAKNAIGILTEDDPKCPPGLCPAVNIYLDVFNFHKPRTGCSNGFGLCIKFDVSVSCHPCNQKATYESGRVMAYIDFTKEGAFLHLPANMVLDNEFKPDDFSFFELDDQSITIRSASGREFFVRGGTYPVDYTGDELIVKLELN